MVYKHVLQPKLGTDEQAQMLRSMWNTGIAASFKFLNITYLTVSRYCMGHNHMGHNYIGP